MVKRVIYLVYYLKNQNWKQYKQFVNYIYELKGERKSLLILYSIIDSLKYNVTPVEYFQFGFFEKDKEKKQLWAGTGTMYEYQLVMNPKSQRDILDDKRKFYKSYSQFVLHKTASIDELIIDRELSDKFLNCSTGKLVFKVSDGKCGAQVDIRNANEFNKTTLVGFMQKNGYDLIEEFIVQHAVMSRLSPSGVNTVRIITQLDKDNNVVILGCRQRISVNSTVDNMAAGNIVAAIDEETGMIKSKAYYGDITKEPVDLHPVTDVEMIGLQIPYWLETIQLVKKAALLHPQNRSIGWDIVITDKGPGLIEGNHDWCKLVWQIPLQQGLKPVLDKHLSEFSNV